MLKLKRADYNGNYHGFTLKKGFWYGIDTETNTHVATSGWEISGAVAIYFLTEGKWQLSWVDIEDADFILENIPEVSTDGKMSFCEWLKLEMGIDWNDWSENYSGQMEDDIVELYDMYYYDGLPRFVQKYL